MFTDTVGNINAPKKPVRAAMPRRIPMREVDIPAHLKMHTVTHQYVIYSDTAMYVIVCIYL